MSLLKVNKTKTTTEKFSNSDRFTIENNYQSEKQIKTREIFLCVRCMFQVLISFSKFWPVFFCFWKLGINLFCPTFDYQKTIFPFWYLNLMACCCTLRQSGETTIFLYKSFNIEGYKCEFMTAKVLPKIVSVQITFELKINIRYIKCIMTKISRSIFTGSWVTLNLIFIISNYYYYFDYY